MQPQKPVQPATVKVRALRSFQDQHRKVIVKDSIAELPYLFAREMKDANKVEFVVEPPAPPPPAKEEKSLFSGGKKEK